MCGGPTLFQAELINSPYTYGISPNQIWENSIINYKKISVLKSLNWYANTFFKAMELRTKVYAITYIHVLLGRPITQSKLMKFP